MSQVHNALRRGPLGRAMKNAVGDTSTDGMLERWGETLQPTIDLWALPEWAYLRGERIAAGVIDSTSGAGTLNEGCLYNPASSKRIGVLMGLTWFQLTGAPGAFGVRLFKAATLPASFTAFPLSLPLDTRDALLNVATPGTGLVLASGLPAVVQGNGFSLTQTALGTVRDEQIVVVLSPGSGIAFGPTAVGISRLIATVTWRERAGTPDELI